MSPPAPARKKKVLVNESMAAARMVAWVHAPGITWCILRDSGRGVAGLAVVERGFRAPVHHHPAAEDYYLLRGAGLLLVGSRRRVIAAPAHVRIASGAPHAFTALTPTALLLFVFDGTAPFASVAYSYTGALLLR